MLALVLYFACTALDTPDLEQYKKKDRAFCENIAENSATVMIFLHPLCHQPCY